MTSVFLSHAFCVPGLGMLEFPPKHLLPLHFGRFSLLLGKLDVKDDL